MDSNQGKVHDCTRQCGGLKRLSCFLLPFLALAALCHKASAAEIMTHWALPQFAYSEADRPVQPLVFGTIPLSVRARPTSTRWSRIMMAPLDQPALAHLASDARNLPPHEQAAFVQFAVSHAVRDRTSRQNCVDDGYWASADETLKRGMGDCIDIAIAKMEALRFLGMSARDLYLTTGYVDTGSDPDKRRESAALLVRIGESFWLLPEQSGDIVEASGTWESASAFNPVVTYGVGMTWIHGRALRTASLKD